MAASFSSDGHSTTQCANQDLAAEEEQPSSHSARRPTYLEILKATLPLSPAFNGIGNKAARNAPKSSHEDPIENSDEPTLSLSKPTPEDPTEVPTEGVNTVSETHSHIDSCPPTLDAIDSRSDISDAAILEEIVETISSTSGVGISDTAQPEVMAQCAVCGVIGSVDSEGFLLCCGKSGLVNTQTNFCSDDITELNHSGQELPPCTLEVGDLTDSPKLACCKSQPTYLEILKAARPLATNIVAMAGCCTEDLQYDVASAVDTDQSDIAEAPTKLGVKRQVGCSMLAFDAIEVGSTVASGSSTSSDALPTATAVLDFPSFVGATPSEASSSQAVSSTAEAGIVEGTDVALQDESDGALPTGHRAVSWADDDGANDAPLDQDTSDEVTPEESLAPSSAKRSRHRRRRTNKNRRSGNKNSAGNGTECAMATTALLMGDSMMPGLGMVSSSSPSGRHVVTWGDLGSDLLLGPVGGNGSVAEAAPPHAVCSPTVTAWSSLVRRATARGESLESDMWTGHGCVGTGHVAIATLAPATTAYEISGQSAAVGHSDALRSWLRFASGLPSCEDLTQQLRTAAPEACANLAEQLRAVAPDTYED